MQSCSPVVTRPYNLIAPHHTSAFERSDCRMADSSTTDSSLDDSSSESSGYCFRHCGKAKRRLWCLGCHGRSCLCLDCSVKLLHCPGCRSEKIIIDQLDIPWRITRFAIGVKPIETPINGVLKALEVPARMPESVRVYSFSELYMTHFRLYCQVSPSNKWLLLERNKDFKGITGGVPLDVLREPDIRLGSRLGENRFGDMTSETIICHVQEIPEFPLRKLLRFRQDQGRVKYRLLRNNCQQFVFNALQHIGAPPTDSFPRWARKLQEKWRRYAQEDARRADG